MSARRVLVACLALEANTFAPGETTLDDFRRQTLATGGDVHAHVLGPGSELAGAWSVLEAAGMTVVPAVVAWSSPSAPMAAAALEQIVAWATAGAGEVDGAYVMLHGSAVAHGDDDPEGTLLSALRSRLGPRRPIAVSLDCHANLTPRMVDAATAFTAYRTCPHLDTARTGEHAARILVEALEHRASPVVAMRSIPMLTPADLHDSSREPFAGLMRACEEEERGDQRLLAACLLPVQPWIDVPGLGWKTVVTADGDLRVAGAAAERLAARAWERREAFLQGVRPPIAAALELALAGPPPFVVADAGDSPSGGAPGDSTELLRAALARGGGGSVLLSVRDPEAAALAVRAGAGEEIEVTLGGGAPGTYNASTRVRARVLHATADAEFRYLHPFAAGYRATTGPAGLLEVGGIWIAVHTRQVMVLDPALYLAVGAEPAAASVVQAKSHVSYRAGFAGLTPRSVVADTPGPTAATLAALPFRRRPRPLFPFEPGTTFAPDGSSESRSGAGARP